MARFAASSAAIFSLAEAEGLPRFCPSASDLVAAYGSGVSLQNQGWTVQGDGGAATKASFNLNGGFVEYDLDVSAATLGVIPNVYTIFPSNIGDAFNHDSDYCDGSDGGNWCVELDWVESNGHCGGHAAFHTVEGGKDRSNVDWKYSSSKMHMRIDYTGAGTQTISIDGKKLQGFSPALDDSVDAVIKQHHQQQGAVIYSSQWTGSWVPAKSVGCGSGSGDISSSHFTVSNLRIAGKVVQGPTPSKCSALEEYVSLEANASVLV